jgi:ADP-ribosylation factor GTPase-activating protein 1
MDAWSADQLKKMQAGGNDKLNQFFKQYGVDKYTDIRDKYNNRVAEVSPPAFTWKGAPDYQMTSFSTRMQVYREKIKADVEGRPFTPPAPSSLQVSLPSKAAPASSGMANRPGIPNGRAGGDDWGDWGGSGGSTGAGAAAGSGGGSGFSNNSEYSKAQYMASAANKEEFFQRRMMVRKRMGFN